MLLISHVINITKYTERSRYAGALLQTEVLNCGIDTGQAGGGGRVAGITILETEQVVRTIF